MKRLLIIALLAGTAFAQGGTTSANLDPATTGQHLGTNARRWNVMAQDLDVSRNLTVNGNAVSTVPANPGTDGKCLVTDGTQPLGLKWGACADDSSVVHKSGDETVNGVKTFPDGIVVGNPESSGKGHIEVPSSSGVTTITLDGDEGVSANDLKTKGPIADIRAFGGVGDGAFVTAGCSGNNCWKGTSNTTALKNAIAYLGSKGGTVRIPAGTWMFGECSYVGATLVTIPDNVTILGSGMWTTVLMLNPDSNCTLLANQDGTSGNFHVALMDLRLDGNIPTDGGHTDILHANNNQSTSNWATRALEWHTGEAGTKDGPSLVLRNVVISGFTGDGTWHTAVYVDGANWVDWDNVRIVYNEYTRGLYFKTSDSRLNGLYMMQNGSWDGSLESLIVEGGIANIFSDCYFGGGDGGAAQVTIKGSSSNEFLGCRNDSAKGIGYRFIQGAGGEVSANNRIVGGAISFVGRGTSGSDYISFEGDSNNNLVVGVNFGPDARAGSHGITELNTATNNLSVGNVFNAIGGGALNFRTDSTSRNIASVGASDTYLSGGPLTVKGASSADPVAGAAILRVNNNGAVSVAMGANGYASGWIQAIQDDGSNNLKALQLNPRGGDVQAAGGSANKAMCWKSDGKTLGYCSTVIGADGSCTCN